MQVASYKNILQDVWDTKYSNTSPKTPKLLFKQVFYDIFDECLTSDSTDQLELEKVTKSNEYIKYYTNP